MSTTTKPFIEPDILQSLQTELTSEKQVILHCCFQNGFAPGMLIRIWKSTFLLDAHSNHKSALLFADRITFYPYWTAVPFVNEYWFTLIFSGLPKNCTHFDFMEIIPEKGGFFVPKIPRNITDVYSITI